MADNSSHHDHGDGGTLSARVQAAVAHALIQTALSLPLRLRLSVIRVVVGSMIGPLVGWRRRALDNLELVWSHRSLQERDRIAKGAMRSAAQVLIENFDPDDMLLRARDFPVGGPGWQSVKDAHEAGRPILILTGHFGNYEAIRAAFEHHGIESGGMYRPMTNPGFNRRYVAAMESLSGPVFPSDRRGTAAFLRALSGGSVMLLLNDLNIWGGEPMQFLGRPAMTATSAARMAIKVDALIVPVYGIRDRKDMTAYQVVVDPPIPHGDPREMTEAFNRSLEARIAADPDQWFWIHRRWKI